MGTSQGKPDAPSGAPLVPPWAAKDPAPPSPAQQVSGQPQATPIQGAPPAAPIAAQDPAPPRRYANFRRALGRFATSGARDDARTAMGHWARTSSGGSRKYSRRLARSARTGGAALVGLARAGAGAAPLPGGIDIRSLAGQPMDSAIDKIVEAFCPPGILDEETIRLAMGEALEVALGSADTFDPAAIDENAIRIATLSFVGEMVFLGIVGDAGESLSAAPSPTAAVERESDIRALVREVTDVLATPELHAAGGTMTPRAMSTLISRLISEAVAEIETWE